MATYFHRHRHDISITDPSTSDVLGFVLSRPNGVPDYQELHGAALVDFLSSEKLTQISTNPEEELLLGETTHHAGFGREYQNVKSSKRYFYGIGADLSTEGSAMLSWGLTGITMPTITATDEANLDWETWSDASTPATWTEDLALTREGTNHHGGTYCAKRNEDNVGWTLAASQSVTWAAEYQSKVCHIRGWGRSSNGWSSGDSGIKFAIYDGTDRTYSGVCGNVTVNTWGQSTWGSHTVNAAGSELTLEVYIKSNGSGYDFLWDDMEFQPPIVGAITSHATFNSNEYVSRGNVLYKLDTGAGASFTYVTTMPATITDLVPFQVSAADYLFCFLGTSNAYWYMITAEAFTESAATNKTYQFGAWVNTTVDTLYANDGDNTLRSTINPLNGGTAWSAQTIVGDAATPITHLQEKSGALLIDKEDMPYYLDSSGNVQKDLAPECQSGKATHSGKNSTIWNGFYWRPTGDQGLLRIGRYTDGSVGNNEWLQPALYTSNNSSFSGQVEATAGDDMWLYSVLDNDTKIEIVRGRDETIDGETMFRWHTYQEGTLTGVETMWISTIYKKRLWITSTTSSEQIFYLPLPTKYASVTTDSERAFLTGGYFVTEWKHEGFERDTKALIKVTATLGHTYDADIYWECHYQKYGDSSWTDLGDFKGSATSKTATLYRSAATASPMFRFKFVGVTNSATKTPILANYTAKCLLYPDVKRLVLMRVRVGRNATDKHGQLYTPMYELQKTCMTNVQDATWPVTVKEYIVEDTSGTTFYGRLLPLPNSIAFQVPTRKEEGRETEWEYTLLFLKVPLS